MTDCGLPAIMRNRQPVQELESGDATAPDIRRLLGLTGAGRIVLTQDEDGIRLTPAESVLRRVRDLAAPFRKSQGSVVDEFIAERRAESAED